jgi:hypothetical protein
MVPRPDPGDAPNPFLQGQGLLAPAILVDAAVLDSAEPYDLVHADIHFVNWALSDAMLIPGEFPPEALFAYHVDFYLAQVNNGGHGQFAGNSQMSAPTIRNIEQGLAAIGAADFQAVFADFLAMMRSDADLARRTLETRGFTGTPEEIKALDERFFALNGTDRLIAQNATWLRGLASLKPLSADAMQAELAAIKASNRLLAARQAKLAAEREAREAKDPVYSSAKRLCAVAGLTFAGFTAGRAAAKPGHMIFGMRTSDGVRMMLLGPDEAVLMDKDQTNVIAKVRVAP